jgi:CBS-domain-containing membrane protein
MSSRAPCTNGQVFDSRYREKVAKTVAKVSIVATYLLSVVCRVSRLVSPVLVAPFGAQNVTFVPSIFLLNPMSNGTGQIKGTCPIGQVLASKGCTFEFVFGNRG